MKKKGNYGKLNKKSTAPSASSKTPVRRKKQTKVHLGKAKSGKGKLFRYEGTFCATDKGYGFVNVEGFTRDVFISERFTNYAFHGDKVLIELLTPGPLYDGSSDGNGRPPKSREAKVIKVLEHSITRIVGTFEEIRNGYGFVIPDKGTLASDLYIPKGNTMDAVTGQKVLAEISDYGEFKRSPEGRIIEIIGDLDDARTDDVSVICALNLRTDFPEAAIRNCDDICGDGTIIGSRSASELDDLYKIEALSDVFKDSFSGKGKRLDLRDIVTFTIDGDDSGDFDDAVSLEVLSNDSEEGGAYIVGVHIADVAEYVREDSPLDAEALERGCSVYFPGRVIPMLPEKLSNGLCSLNPDEDRLSLSAIMLLGRDGKTIDHVIAESVIRSSKRMTYGNVDKVLEGAVPAGYEAFADELEDMAAVSEILRKRRFSKGSVDFDVDECEISVDENGKVTDIKTRERSTSRSLIEEFMLLANKTVAKQFCKKKIPFAYRVHEDPDMTKIRDLVETFKNLGLSVDRKILKKVNGSDDESISSFEIAKLMDEAKGSPFEMLIKTLTLRSMQRAEYKPESLGHYGLAFKYYCHFTSPIRRYPDLQIHRIIKQTLRGKMKAEAKEHYASILPEVCRKSSVCERRAQEAEYQVDRLKMIRYMEEHMGEEFEGTVSGVTRYGVFVKLDNSIEGMISVYDLPSGDYIYEESLLRLTGRRSRRYYSIGKRMRVSVSGCDLNQRVIDFVPAE